MIPRSSDALALVRLYRDVYGGTYPLALGRDEAEVRRLLALPTTHWRVVRGPQGTPVASAMVVEDPLLGVGVLAGIAVHPDHAGHGLAHLVSQAACASAFGNRAFPSAYATVRLCSPQAQRVVLDQGFRPVGVLPRAARLARRETLGLFVRHAPGAWEARRAPGSLPLRLLPLYSRALAALGREGRLVPAPAAAPSYPHGRAPQPGTAPPLRLYRLDERRPRRHAIATASGSSGVVVDLDPANGNARLVNTWPSHHVLPRLLGPALDVLRASGIDYLDAAIPLIGEADNAAVESHLAAGMSPTAYYPAAYRHGGALHDLVFLACCAEPVERHLLRPCSDITAFLTP
ncbi:GNAT family N-acetyltransferase [Corynebacterium mastitidis]|uniref:GNAT family N-acetyltransferase n=1 Tax=Corynebacterium mastitidis TaxID=161890 RepID=UPI00037A73D7|nr:GNAT family N-acetyltransferase [Corynebacterium mastitidis]